VDEGVRDLETVGVCVIDFVTVGVGVLVGVCVGVLV